jgi:HlyD family secretion protein
MILEPVMLDVTRHPPSSVGGRLRSMLRGRTLGAAVVALLAAGVVGFYGWRSLRQEGQSAGLASGNGRIEATEVDVATRLAGRVAEIYVAEGDFVVAGQRLARIDVGTLQAQRDEAVARHQQALHAVAGAEAQVALRESDRAAAQALVVEREAELDAAQRRLARSEAMAEAGSFTAQQLDDDRARVRTAQAAVAAARAQVDATRAAIRAARTGVTGARSAVRAAAASVARIDADLADCVLEAPRDARVQYRVAEPGEVLPAGGKVLNLVDLTDVYMTFFLPETVAGRVALGSDARIVLDAAPRLVIPATISFVASTAQFTPKTVETASERQKLMFRVKARIDRKLLQQHVQQVKTGLPGVAWVRVDPKAAWPAHLAVRLTP